MRRLSLLSLVVLLLPGLGCGDEVTSALRVERVGWDTLRVAAAFTRADAVGRTAPVLADSLEVRVFSAAYDTLYAGAGPLVPIPDALLGDREAIMVEACLPVEGHRVCEQEAVAASPKRIRATLDVTFPQGSDYRRGAYDVGLVVERERYDGTGWERLPRHGPLDAYLLATVQEAPDRTAATVRVPVRAGEGRFDLARYPAHDDFAYHLRSRLHDARAANVRFELYAALGREPERLAAVDARVQEKTDADRADEVRVFVEQAVEQLIDRLEVFDRARVYVDDWQFDPVLNAYSVELEVVGRGGRFFDRFDRERLYGTLRVLEDGTEAVFRVDEASRGIEAAWRQHVQDATLRLDRLEPLWAQRAVRDGPVTPLR